MPRFALARRAVRTAARALARAAVGAVVASLAAPLAAPLVRPLEAQYFGRNKVNYETFDFRILRTPTFDVHYYPPMDTAAADAGRMADRWYARLRPFMRHELTRRSLIFFADQPDFQQNNVTDIEGEGTGGVTESFRQRVVMPFAGTYGDTHHVLGHELVHVFQYDIAEEAIKQGGAGAAQGLNSLPLWLVEGMAEYLSLGRADVNTATWLRDAARRNDVPTLRQLTTDPRYFPYRYGQALWAYVGGRWGDQAVVDVYRASLRFGFEGAIRRVLDVSTDQLSKDWAAAIKGAYLPQLAGRTPPDSTATVIVRQKGKRGGEYNIAPVISPDGRMIAFYSSRGLFGIDLYIADATTGRVIRQLGSINTPRHFDALSFIASAGSWSPDGRRLAYVVYRGGDQIIEIYDVAGRRTERQLKTPDIGAAVDPAWSPDGRTIAFTGLRGGISDLYTYDLATDRVTRLTNGREAELQPAWSPDGRTLAFVTDRGPGTDFERLTFSPTRIATMDVGSRAIALVPGFPNARHINPQWAPDGRSIYAIADPDGFSDVYRLDLAGAPAARLTRTATGISGITNLSPALSVARGTGRMVFSVFDRGGYNIARIDDPGAIGTTLALDAFGAAGTSGSDGAGSPVAAAGMATGGGTSSGSAMALGGVLPPVPPARPSVIEGYLSDAGTGLATGATYTQRPYKARIALDYIAPPTVGVGYNTFLGSQVAGGIAALFGDQLGNQRLVAVVQAQGQIQDIGGQVQYLNTRRRWNWGAIGGYLPFLSGGLAVDPNTRQRVLVIQRFINSQVAGLVQYPLNTTQRFEFNGGVSRQSTSTTLESYATGRRERTRLQGWALSSVNASAAFVGDYSLFGLTSPIAGARYRFEVTPTVSSGSGLLAPLGRFNYTNVTADYRRYLLARPVTFAFRGMHFGRYNSPAVDSTLGIYNGNYIGNPIFVRGYDVFQNLDPQRECPATANSFADCPAFTRTLGSRMAVASAEIRVPLLGVEGLGLIRTNAIPLEIAPFVDAGLAWSAGETPKLRFAGADEALNGRAQDRVPVFSAGVTARINLLGFAVVEAFYAVPFQRPDRRGRFGFQLAPGW